MAYPSPLQEGTWYQPEIPQLRGHGTRNPPPREQNDWQTTVHVCWQKTITFLQLTVFVVAVKMFWNGEKNVCFDLQSVFKMPWNTFQFWNSWNLTWYFRISATVHKQATNQNANQHIGGYWEDKSLRSLDSARLKTAFQLFSSNKNLQYFFPFSLTFQNTIPNIFKPLKVSKKLFHWKRQ